jgi:hypothetical protein
MSTKGFFSLLAAEGDLFLFGHAWVCVCVCVCVFFFLLFLFFLLLMWLCFF